jgi:NTE family protein
MEYFKLLADQQVEVVFPRTRFNETSGFFDLFLDFKKENHLNVEFGGDVSSAPVNEAYVGLRYNYLNQFALNLGASSHIGRFYSAAQISARIEFPFNIPLYLKSSISFNQWDYFKTSTYFFEDKNPSYLIQNEDNIDLHVGVPFGRKGKIDIGGAIAHIRDDYYQRNTFSRTDTADKTYFDMRAVDILYEINTLNRKQYASDGENMYMDLKYITGKETTEPGSTSMSDEIVNRFHSWGQFKLRYINYYPFWKKFRFGVHAEVLLSSILSSTDMFSNYSASVLMAPAFQPIPESKLLFIPEFRAFNYGAGGMKLLFNISNNLVYDIEGYIFLPYQQIIQQSDYTAELGPPFSARLYMASTAFIYHSPIGPVSLSLNFYDRTVDKLSFIFNLGYVIFNKRAID